MVNKAKPIMTGDIFKLNKPFCKVTIASKKMDCDEITVLYSGTLAEQYGVMNLIDEFLHLKGNYRLIICGGGDNSPRGMRRPHRRGARRPASRFAPSPRPPLPRGDGTLRPRGNPASPPGARLRSAAAAGNAHRHHRRSQRIRPAPARQGLPHPLWLLLAHLAPAECAALTFFA